jgi:hypothetical protein
MGLQPLRVKRHRLNRLISFALFHIVPVYLLGAANL